VVKVRRAFAWRVHLTVFIFFVILPMPSLIDIDGAWGADVPTVFNEDYTSKMSADLDDTGTGFTIIAPYSQYKVYLVDGDGVVVHTWTSNRLTTGTVELLPDGTLLRGRSGANRQPDGVHILDWDGTVLWDYTPPSPYTRHHDIEPLPNGNILLNAAVVYNASSMKALGRDPQITDDIIHIEPILEIKPNGTKGGDIVWMWNPLDHIIQDFDPSKPNYGVVKDHPELVDINYPRESPNEWQHSNAVAYNAELDQIMITNRNIDELWVIDHNTTTAEAAGHTGGAHGKGGDLLYRWGNPGAYDSGSDSDHILWGPHDAHWIGPGLPGEGNILVFNNGLNMYMSRPEGSYSSIEELVPPVNGSGGYNRTQGAAYGPSNTVWRYAAEPAEDFYAWAMGGAQRLPDGNTLICGGSSGRNFEVEPDGDEVWNYTLSSQFKANRYYPPALEPITDQIATEDIEFTMNLGSMLTDLDTDIGDLMIEARSNFAHIEGHTVRLVYPEGVLTDKFDLMVSDGIFEVGREVLVNVSPVNDPPSLGTIPDIEAQEDVPFILDLRSFTVDPDTPIDKMLFTVDSPYVSIKGTELVFIYPDGVLTDKVLLTVSDGELEDSREIAVTIKPVNDPPMVDGLPVQTGLENVPWTIDLGLYIKDEDSPLEDISVVSHSPYAFVSGLKVTFIYPEDVTRDLVRLSISDGSEILDFTIEVIIEPVNDPPEIGKLPTAWVKEDIEHALNLESYLHDIDTPVEALTIHVGSPYIAVEGHTLYLLYPDGIQGDEVVVEVSDGFLRSSTTLTVIVEPVNDPPVMGNIPFVVVHEDEPFFLEVSELVFDIDTPIEELTLEVASPYITLEGQTLVLLYPDGVGEDGVVIRVSDGEFTVSAILTVNIVPVNDPPWWSALPEITAIEDVEGGLDLTLFMNDIDTPTSLLVVGVVSAHGAMVGHVFRFLYPEGVLGEPVTFTLSDGEFQAVLTTTVVVQPVNDAPELISVGVEPANGRAGASFRFTVVFKDVDMGSDDPLVEIVIDGIAHVCALEGSGTPRYDEGVVYFYETDLRAGVHSYHFSADDGDGGSISTLPLSVEVEHTDVEAENTNLTPFIVVAIAMAVLVVVMLILLRGRRQRTPAM